MPKFELFGSMGCPHMEEMREWLEWRGEEFVEYDVESDRDAFNRLKALAGGQQTVPVLVEDGKVMQIGWRSRMCG